MLNVLFLGLTSLFTDIASEMVYPLVPFFLTSTLGASPSLLGLIEGIAESVASLLKVYAGALSDRFRRRKALTIAGYGTSVLGRLLLATAAGWGGVLGGRIVDRLGKGIRTAPRDALIAESAHHGIRGRVFGIHRGMDTAGAAIGVLIAMAYLSGGSSDYRTVILWSLVPACIGVLILFLVKESRPQTSEKKRPSLAAWREFPRSLKQFLVVSLIFSLGNSSNAFLLLRAAGSGSVVATALPAYLLYNIFFMISAYPAGRLSDAIGRRRILAAGYVVYAIVYIGFALQGSGSPASQIMILFSVYGIYSGLTEGIEKAFVADCAPTYMRATAIGLHATVVGLGVLPASVIAGLLWDHAGAAAPFFAGAGLALAAAVAMVLFVRE